MASLGGLKANNLFGAGVSNSGPCFYPIPGAILKRRENNGEALSGYFTGMRVSSELTCGWLNSASTRIKVGGFGNELKQGCPSLRQIRGV